MKNDTEQTLTCTELCWVLFFLLVVMAVTGCATSPEEMKYMADWQANQKPTLELTCPSGGCKLSYVDPRDRANVPKITNGWDFANRVTDTIGTIATTAVVPAAFAITATRGFDALKGSGAVTNTTHTTTTTSTTSNATTTSTTASLTGSGVIGSGTNTAPTTTTTTTTTDNHSQTATPTVVNGRICSIDAGGNLVCQP